LERILAPDVAFCGPVAATPFAGQQVPTDFVPDEIEA
jgi:hypothetical protein